MVHITHIRRRYHETFLDIILQGEKTIMVSSFTSLVQTNHFGATRKLKLLHGTIKSAVLDISMSFQKHLWGNPILDASGKSSLSLQWYLWGYKAVDPPTKHQKDIPVKVVFHTYRKKYSHLSTSIRQMIAGAFFFGMQSCEYPTTPKGGISKHTTCGRGT